MKKLLLLALTMAPAIYGFGRSMPLNVTTDDQYQFDSWVSQAARDVADLARKTRVPGGVPLSFSLEVCIDGEIADVIFTSVTVETGAYVFKNETTPTGRDCKTSKDFAGINLSNAEAFKFIEDTYREYAKEAGRGAVVPDVQTLPALIRIPFLPGYDASAYPAQPAACERAATPDALFVNHEGNTVTRISGCDNKVLATIKTGVAPLQVAVTPDGSTALVTSFVNALTFIDLSTNAAVIVNTPGDTNPSGVAISPDGSYAYVTSFNGSSAALLKVDMAGRQIVQRLALANYPQAVFFNSDGSQAYVTFPFQNVMYIIDTLTTTVARTVALPGPAFSVAFNSTGTRAYIACKSQTGTVQVCVTKTYRILQAVNVPTGPTDLRVSLDDQLIFVGSYEGQAVSVIDAVSLAVQSVKLSGSPRGLAVTQY